MASKRAGKPNLSDFVRSMPTAKAADVVEAARAKGLKLKAGLVYAVRAAQKAKQSSKGKPGRKPGPKPKAASVGAGNLDAVIRQLAWSHGLLAVEASIQRLRADAGL